MREYTRTNHSNACPICNDTKGKCQIHRDGNFVMCMNTHSEVNGYHYKGVNKSGVWGMHSLTNVVLSEQESKERKIAQERANRERLETLKRESLPVADRDKAIRAIHKTIGLSQADKERLIKRGLTEPQIELGLFFSVKGKTKVPNNTPSNLGGITIDSDSSLNLCAKDAYACHAFDYQGNAIGWQYRNNDIKSGDKYFWAKGIKSSRLPNDEMPITYISGDKVSSVKKSAKIIVQQWLESGPLPTDFINQIVPSGPDSNLDNLNDSDTLEQKQNLKVIFATEGLLKPHVASCRLGVDTIGAAGFNFSTSSEQVREIITNGGYNCVVFPLDGGAVVNRMIMSQLAKNVKLFESLGCQIFIGWWSQLTKNENDFDEIDSLEQVRLITYDKLKNISKDAIFRKWKKDELVNLTKFTPDKVIDKPRFYDKGAISDDEIDFILDNNQEIIIKGSKASGKSYMVKQYIERWQKKGGKVINIGCRRVLCEAQSHEWGITFIEDAQNERYSLSTIFERDGGLSIVVDSLLKLKHIDWENTLVILDEFEQFVSHLLTANTAVKDHRGYILQFLEDSLKSCLRNGGKIIALDADASDLSCDWLEGVTGVKPFKLENISNSHNNNCFIVEGNNDGYKKFIQSILNDLFDDKKIFVASDSRKDLEALLIEVKKEFPDKSCEIVTSDTVAEKNIRDFIKSPDKTIKDTHIAMLGASPVMQSGVSINTKDYFSKVYGICTGIIEPSIMRQLLGRVRDDCDRYLWISDKARGIYSTDFDYQKILKNKEFVIKSLPDLAQYETALNENLTNTELLDKFKGLLDKQDSLTDINSVTKAKLTARHNLVLSDYRAVLINELKNEGYNVEYFSSNNQFIFDCDISATKKELDMAKAIAVNNAKDINSIESERIKNKPYATKDEQNQLLKYAIKDNLPLVALNPLFILSYIIKDRWELVRAVKRFWFTQNKEIAQKLDIKGIHYQHKVALNGGKYWLEDLKPNIHYVALFERLGLSEFINDELIVSKHSDSLKAFFQRCKDYQKVDGISNRELLRSCGVKFSNNVELINLLRKIVNLFGFKLECVDRSKNENGSTIRHYRVIKGCNNELWTQLINSFDFKYQQLEPINYDFELENDYDYDSEFCEYISFENENAVTHMSNALESGPLPTDFINQIVPGGPNLNTYTVSDLDISEQTPNFESKLSSNHRELIGKKCYYWDNNNQWGAGFVTDILDFGIQLSDDNNNISYCDLSQIEFEDGFVPPLIPLTPKTPLSVKVSNSISVVSSGGIPYQPNSLDDSFVEIDKSSAQSGDYIQFKNQVQMILGENQYYLFTSTFQLSKKYDTFKVLKKRESVCV